MNGDLVRETNGSTVQTYLVDDGGLSDQPQTIEAMTNGVLTASYAVGHGLLSQWTQSGGTSFDLRDGLGSITGLTSSTSGALVAGYTYGAFGEPIAAAGAETSAFRFAGGRYDDTTGQYKFGLRNYDPEIARFTSGDPLSGTDAWTINHYVYANSNPVNLVDPAGTISLAGVLTAVGITATAVSIAMPAISVVNQTRQLLSISDFVISLREGLNGGWLDYDEFMQMHRTAQVMAVEVSQKLIGSLFELGKAVLELSNGRLPRTRLTYQVDCLQCSTTPKCVVCTGQPSSHVFLFGQMSRNRHWRSHGASLRCLREMLTSC